LRALPEVNKQKQLLFAVEEFTLHGANLWVSLKGSATEPSAALLRSALLDAGLDPFRLNFPPLMEELRRQLDPQGTLVVMEA
jgi:hypothetical protein